LYLLLTAEMFLFTMWFSMEDFPALGAPIKHDFRSFEPTGDSLHSKL